MQVYLITLGKGLKGPTRINGALFLGEKALHFVCNSLGRYGGNDFSSLGEIGAAIEAFKKTGVLPPVTEEALRSLTATTRESFSSSPDEIALLAKSMWTGSKIHLKNGEKRVVWAPGFGGAFRDQAREWAHARGVATKGL